ncbi:Hsp20 family protein [Vibrio sp. Isolate25]|uniref:Hsp20 family protein n=1 Tax=Vibrio TaxID=662 RepID=UPI001EFEB74D|nr:MULTISPECIES: Hsp20 family protein [Vibrio]MCG9596421.1 Hsp20 family protein [Vibrio sp. Isolate25]MCG9677844.1 Hsp20 family protein [Vibrio sp. Isolate24]USD34706.1 Hsp20 family protein [Vibrio sp. SCSIO 43186]USD47772.1 Hsp20 family protein [Vibrio sp. SCSIO 43145]USD71831.1 Hsp20 family protein [Vibrio sp. SCSIO 43139]
MNSIDLTPLYRTTIGFDRVASLLNSALTSDPIPSGYPPYNIEMLGEGEYSITLAVAGFSQDDIDIQVENGLLTIKGNKESSKDDDQSKMLYQGIANRSFERRFNLAEYVEVTDATMKDGLLAVYLKKEIPEAMKPKRIEIQSHDNNVIEHKK